MPYSALIARPINGEEPPTRSQLVNGPAGIGNPMKTYLVMCTKKHAHHGRIESIGCVDSTTGAEFRLSESEAIQQIQSKIARFVTRDNKGHEAIVEWEERDGRKFLITKPDHFLSDNLSALPECSPRVIVPPPVYHPVAPARSHGVHRNWVML